MPLRRDARIAVEAAEADADRGGSPALRLKTAEPQSTQKTFSAPPSGAHERRCSSPCRWWNEPGVVRPFADAAVPVRRWQRVQWQ